MKDGIDILTALIFFGLKAESANNDSRRTESILAGVIFIAFSTYGFAYRLHYVYIEVHMVLAWFLSDTTSFTSSTMPT